MTASRNISVDADTVSRLLESEEKCFNEWLERLTKNGIEDKAAASAIVASANRYDGLKMLQRGYLQG